MGAKVLLDHCHLSSMHNPTFHPCRRSIPIVNTIRSSICGILAPYSDWRRLAYQCYSVSDCSPIWRLCWMDYLLDPASVNPRRLFYLESLWIISYQARPACLDPFHGRLVLGPGNVFLYDIRHCGWLFRANDGGQLRNVSMDISAIDVGRTGT